MAALESRGDQGNRHGVDKPPAGVAEDHLLHSPVVCDADKGKNLLHVKGQQAISTPLGEETNNAGQEESTTHGRITDHIRPDKLFCELLLLLDRRLNLGELEPGVFVSILALGVILLENGKSLLVAVPGDEPSRAFGKPPDEDELARAGDKLEKTRQPP